MGWEALEQWGDDVARIEPLAGGVANDVWSVRVNGHLAVGRLGARSDADLAWETELLQHLDREGLTVPVPIPTTDGRLFADGLVVMTYVEGGPPETEADWRRVADALRQLHRLTRGWPQRPGWRSSTDLLHAETGTRDESHVDVPDLDLVLPHNAAGLDDDAHDIAAQASAAWEAAVCWDDEHAVKRLAEVERSERGAGGNPERGEDVRTVDLDGCDEVRDSRAGVMGARKPGSLRLSVRAR